MRPRKTLVAALAAVAVTALVFGLSRTELGKIFEYKTLDYRSRLRPWHPLAREVLGVAIDDKCLEVAGRWPWSREIHAALLDVMASHRPAAVGFDMLFTEPDNTGSDADPKLAISAKRVGCVVFGAATRSGETAAVLEPLAMLREGTTWGLINADRDPDGVLRRLPLWVPVGNMGSTVQFDYTVIGDEVNLGARLEALTREYRADIIISEATYLQVREQLQTRPLGEVMVKGRTQPVRVYAVDGVTAGT